MCWWLQTGHAHPTDGGATDYTRGDDYYLGRGVEQDYIQAVQFYRLAAAQNHAGAQWTLGLCYKNGQGVAQDHVQAVEFYRLAAAQNHAIAQ